MVTRVSSLLVRTRVVRVRERACEGQVVVRIIHQTCQRVVRGAATVRGEDSQLVV